MKRLFIQLLTVIGIILSLAVLPQSVFAASTFSGGTGTESDPYLISTAEDLQQLASDVNAAEVDSEIGFAPVYYGSNFKMTNDIDLSTVCSAASETSWTPVGSYGSDGIKAFSGTFDGDGHTISGLYVNDTSSMCVGLFGFVYSDSVALKNLTVEGSVTGSYMTGGICGFLYGGTVNCTNKALVTCNGTGDYAYVGGICGATGEGGNVDRCSNLGNISGGIYAGGIAGSGYIKNCYNYASVAAGDGGVAGGIIGYCDSSKGTVKYCYNQGSGGANTSTAGIAGKVEDITDVSYCYYSRVYSGQLGIGGTTEDTENCAEVANATDLKRGRITYLMNSDNQDKPAWYQAIGSDDYPVLDSTHGQVYQVTYVMSADTDDYGYANYGGTASYVPSVITAHTGWYASDGTPFTASTAVTEDITVTQKLGAWITDSDAGYYAETADADSKEGVVRFLAKYSFADIAYITADKIKSYGIWFMESSDDTDFDNGKKVSATSEVDAYPGIYADITGITNENTICYAKAYIEYDPDGDGTYEYMYSDLITKTADFTKWLGAKPTNNDEDIEIEE